MQDTHRFRDQLEHFTLPRPAAPAPAPGNFIALPQAFAGLQPWQVALYRHAYEAAQEIARPSLLERDLVGVWN